MIYRNIESLEFYGEGEGEGLIKSTPVAAEEILCYVVSCASPNGHTVQHNCLLKLIKCFLAIVLNITCFLSTCFRLYAVSE